MSEFGDNLKIREDALKIKEKDLDDTLKSIDSENTKTSFALAFESLLVIQSFEFLVKKPLWMTIPYAAIIFFAIVLALYNLFAKKVVIHTNVDDVFIRKNENNNWDSYIDRKYERINDAYKNAKDLLNTKASLTKLTFIFLGIAVLILLIGSIIC